jgi:DNA-directed RNA polymerase
MASGKEYPWEKRTSFVTGWKESGYLAKQINNAIGEVMRCANAVMEWIRGAAKLFAQNQLPLTWETPSGFRVLQNYLRVTPRRIQTMLDGAHVSMRYIDETDEVMTRRAVQGSSPNYIHSLDAAHLTHTVLSACEQGVDDLMVIHDCFGVHAANAGNLSRILRKEFIEIHLPHRLQNLKLQLERYGPELPDVPERGTFDINLVNQSEYLFS